MANGDSTADKAVRVQGRTGEDSHMDHLANGDSTADKAVRVQGRSAELETARFTWLTWTDGVDCEREKKIHLRPAFLRWSGIGVVYAHTGRPPPGGQ